MKKKLQVFVSSTFNDLKNERQAAVSAILKAGHIPAGMELFNAGDKSQLDTIKKWIDESDVYMLILAGRYGSIEPVSGVGYTEIEFDYASQQGKPLFSVVISEEALEEKVKKFGSAVMEKDNPAPMKLFREKVLSNISSFFNDEKDIRLCVHESLADLRDNANIKGWVSVNELEDTRGLHEEIARLREENDKLRSLVEKSKAERQPVNTDNSPNLLEMADVFSAIEIEIPAEAAGKNSPIKTDLLTLIMSNKEKLINGVYNSTTAGDAEMFLYTNIFPKLILYDLAENEKIPGVRYRRSFLNKKGADFVAFLEKTSLRSILGEKKSMKNSGE
ncbi:DUF4062 domain-containing protein [Azospirillum thiophilum]|uniref:DUF4062 domain-containing protein n=1 Tax=Azospirillum thiophilum TaxID=528244 RepID=UPI0009E2C55F|nr:DUF4062 domain-containing protein [Azospirillum thiophilum]